MSVSELPVLDAEEQRILGSLLEKQATVPASYPLTANALRTACNQTNNREPVVDLDQQTVERTAKALKDRGLLRIVWSDTGRRTLKYHQVLDERLGLEPDERAVLTVLLLRGAQAPGELRTRTERLHGFADRGEVEACLHRMASALSPWCASWSCAPGSRIDAGSISWAPLPRTTRARPPRLGALTGRAYASRRSSPTSTCPISPPPGASTATTSGWPTRSSTWAGWRATLRLGPGPRSR